MSDMKQGMSETGRQRSMTPRSHTSAQAGPGLFRRAADAGTGRRRPGRAAGAALSAAAVLVVAAAAVALAGVVGRAHQTGSPASSPAGVVPWVNRPAAAYVPSALPAAAAPHAKYPPCGTADLAGRVSSSFGIGAGRYTRYLVLTNVSGRACTLSGGPSAISGIQAGGGRTAIAGPASVSADPQLIGPANLRPGQSAQLAITTASLCPSGAATCPRRSYAQVAISIRGGQLRVSFAASQPLSVISGGGLAVSTFGVPATQTDQISSPLDALTVTIATPRTLTAGTTDSYRVTLRNPSSHPVALSPCPSYAEFVAPMGSNLSHDVHRYFLNCGAVSAIPAGGSVTFAMRVAVPKAGGLAKFGWILQGTSVEGGGAVTVRPATGG